MAGFAALLFTVVWVVLVLGSFFGPIGRWLWFQSVETARRIRERA